MQWQKLLVRKRKLSPNIRLRDCNNLCLMVDEEVEIKTICMRLRIIGLSIKFTFSRQYLKTQISGDMISFQFHKDNNLIKEINKLKSLN